MGRPPYPGRLHYFIGRKTRALLIERFAKHPDHEPYLRELGRGICGGMGALHTELRELSRIGLISSSARGGARYFRLNLSHPLTRPLCDLVAACDLVDSTPIDRLKGLSVDTCSFIVDRRAPCTYVRTRDIDAEQLARVGRALAHPARIRILQIIAEHGECRGQEVFSGLPLAQSTISQHLKVLGEAQLISSHAVGTALMYRLNRDTLDSFAYDIADGFASPHASGLRVTEKDANGRVRLVPGGDRHP
ncbi:MAG: helix-turn-helix transcriptional regulator [Clostridiales bacterium]|nr:helix-turn-helix transcriptional regulator [Clostridiales bacterium]